MPEKNQTPIRVDASIRRVALATLLPIPQVDQNGPRNSKRTRVGRSRLVTDPEEFAAIEKKNEDKMEKEKKKAEAAEKRAEKKKENKNQKTKKVAAKNPVASGSKVAQSSKKRQSDKENAQPEASQTTAIQTREDSSSQRTRFHRLVKPIFIR